MSDENLTPQEVAAVIRMTTPDPTREVQAHSSAPPCSAIDGLQYIADSPAQEHGGFHPQTVAIAKEALAEIQRLRGVLEWIASQQNLFFAECSQAEAIIAKCKEALSPNGEVRRGGS